MPELETDEDEDEDEEEDEEPLERREELEEEEVVVSVAGEFAVVLVVEWIEDAAVASRSWLDV